MADLYVHIAVLSLLVAVALLLLGVHIASIARDTDAWVIVRAVARVGTTDSTGLWGCVVISPVLVALLAVAAVLVYVPLVLELADEVRSLRSGPRQQEARQAPDAAEKIRSRVADGSSKDASALGVLCDHDRSPGWGGHVMPLAGIYHGAVSAGGSHLPRGSVCG